MNDSHWFADRKEEVNWGARCEYDKEFVEQLYDRILHSYEEFMHGSSRLNLLLPVSGGLDSSVVTWSIIDMARQATKDGKAKDTDIIVVNFASDESSYAKEFYTAVVTVLGMLVSRSTVFEKVRLHPRLQTLL